jgi:hypothetical protein
MLNDYFSSVYTIDNTTTFPLIAARSQSQMEEFTISTAEVEICLQNINPNKTMGPDGVHPYVLNRAYKSLAVPLTMLFNQSYLSRTLPDAWKEAHITPIFKKGSRLVPSNYRPISLTSTVCKTMERIVAKKITNHFDANN